MLSTCSGIEPHVAQRDDCLYSSLSLQEQLCVSDKTLSQIAYSKLWRHRRRVLWGSRRDAPQGCSHKFTQLWKDVPQSCLHKLAPSGTDAPLSYSHKSPFVRGDVDLLLADSHKYWIHHTAISRDFRNQDRRNHSRAAFWFFCMWNRKCSRCRKTCQVIPCTTIEHSDKYSVRVAETCQLAHKAGEGDSTTCCAWRHEKFWLFFRSEIFYHLCTHQWSQCQECCHCRAKSWLLSGQHLAAEPKRHFHLTIMFMAGHNRAQQPSTRSRGYARTTTRCVFVTVHFPLQRQLATVQRYRKIRTRETIMFALSISDDSLN